MDKITRKMVHTEDIPNPGFEILRNFVSAIIYKMLIYRKAGKIFLKGLGVWLLMIYPWNGYQSHASLLQEGHSVHGTVTSEPGETLAGVNISVQGLAKNTVTDNNGNYSIVVQEPQNAILLITYEEYENQGNSGK